MNTELWPCRSRGPLDFQTPLDTVLNHSFTVATALSGRDLWGAMHAMKQGALGFPDTVRYCSEPLFHSGNSTFRKRLMGAMHAVKQRALGFPDTVQYCSEPFLRSGNSTFRRGRMGGGMHALDNSWINTVALLCTPASRNHLFVLTLLEV